MEKTNQDRIVIPYRPPKVPKPRSKQRLHLYQKEQILKLKYGNEPYDFANAQKISLKAISVQVGVKPTTICQFLSDYKKDRLLERSNYKKGHRKVTIDHIMHLTSL